MTTPLNWKAMVEEALRRRKQEGLTQREHAALADVSIPTMAAFERAETTLSLAKAFDVLRVVGLVDEPGPEDEHQRFVREAMARWRELTETLPKDSPGRMPHGWFRFDYRIDGDLRIVTPQQLADLLALAKSNHTGRPLFSFPHNQECAHIRYDENSLDCWLHSIENSDADPSRSDFWSASNRGHFFVIRGHQEDGQESFSPESILDPVLAIWRIGEALLHAAHMARSLMENSDIKTRIVFRAFYTGLHARILKPWSDPLAKLGYEGLFSASHEALLEAKLNAKDIEQDLAGCVAPLVSSLYKHFGVPEARRELVDSQLKQMLSRTVLSRR